MKTLYESILDTPDIDVISCLKDFFQSSNISQINNMCDLIIAELLPYQIKPQAERPMIGFFKNPENRIWTAVIGRYHDYSILIFKVPGMASIETRMFNGNKLNELQQTYGQGYFFSLDDAGISIDALKDLLSDKSVLIGYTFRVGHILASLSK